MGWTDERVEVLKRLWLDGHSASVIAKELGQVTRNAVVGKVHRLALSGRTTPSQPAPRPVFKAPKPPRPILAVPPVQRLPLKAKALPAPEPELPPSAPIAPVVYIEERGTATVLTLGAHMCKWPIGDPATSEFTFCGKRAGAEGPYCSEHARVAYQPKQVKIKKKAPNYYIPQNETRIHSNWA